MAKFANSRIFFECGTGINQTDLLMLERHIVYSLSKEKTAAQFFLMRCTQAINEDVAQVPIKDVIDRFFS